MKAARRSLRLDFKGPTYTRRLRNANNPTLSCLPVRSFHIDGTHCYPRQVPSRSTTSRQSQASPHEPSPIPQTLLVSQPTRATPPQRAPVFTPQPLNTSQSICLTRSDQNPKYPTRKDRNALVSVEKFFSQAYRFLYSASTIRNHPINTHIPEIIVLGASNVGKSSFLNALVGRNKAARVSQRPGHTSTMNAFGIGSPEMLIKNGMVPKGERLPDHGLILMDTPGYGFRSRDSWGATILKYLELRKALRGAVVLISAEKKVSEEDGWVLAKLAATDTRATVVLTKADKLGNEWPVKCQSLAETLREDMASLSTDRWKEANGWDPDVYVTAAGMSVSGKLGNGGGLGGVRMAILEMAGYRLSEKEVKTKPENVSYEGDVVGFDDIQWKS